MAQNATPWLALRLAAGLSQRDVEKRLGWFDKHRGRLSLIERGIPPDAAQEQQLREFYGALLTTRAKEAIA
jgi:transcriptional regulator with XRE-family HTH domain